MEKESNISLGGAIILLALIAQTIFVGGKTEIEREKHCLQICVWETKDKLYLKRSKCVGGGGGIG